MAGRRSGLLCWPGTSGVNARGLPKLYGQPQWVNRFRAVAENTLTDEAIDGKDHSICDGGGISRRREDNDAGEAGQELHVPGTECWYCHQRSGG